MARLNQSEPVPKFRDWLWFCPICLLLERDVPLAGRVDDPFIRRDEGEASLASLESMRLGCLEDDAITDRDPAAVVLIFGEHVSRAAHRVHDGHASVRVKRDPCVGLQSNEDLLELVAMKLVLLDGDDRDAWKLGVREDVSLSDHGMHR